MTTSLACRFPLPLGPNLDGLVDMGQKYVPTIKDQKAGQRFQQKQHVQSKFIKPAAKPPVKKKR
jgi:hypothetical protein